LNAGVAQLVEQLIRNEKVEGSIPFSGTILICFQEEWLRAAKQHDATQ
jgi:phosphohistidine phosphatase SixA